MTSLDEIQWKSPEWIQQFGLHTGNVLDYFTELPFFDRTSNNQVLKMQFQFQPVPNYNLQNKLSEMVGVEFIIAFIKEPNFWIIRKQQRINPSTVIPKQDYYIIGANIYQSPRIHDILSSRLLASVLSMKNSIDLLNEISNYNIMDGGHQYNKSSSITNTNTPTSVTTTSETPVTTNNLEEISSNTFDNLLKSVVNSNNDSIYLDDLPMYGKNSTVDQLNLKLNL